MILEEEQRLLLISVSDIHADVNYSTFDEFWLRDSKEEPRRKTWLMFRKNILYYHYKRYPYYFFLKIIVVHTVSRSRLVRTVTQFVVFKQCN